jgi:hypothetical protein
VSLDTTKLEKARRLPDGSVRARCPACAAQGHDKKGEHLMIGADGRYGCAVHPRDAKHRRIIWALAGEKAAKPIEVRCLGRLGRAGKTLSQPEVLQRNILGRLGRVEQSHAGNIDPAREDSQAPPIPTPKLIGFSPGVPSVPSGNRMPHFTPDGTLIIPFDSPELFHWWKGGQSLAETKAELLRLPGMPVHAYE